jgi:hypothetical protein
MNKTARTNAANKKNEAQLKTFERAQIALAIHKIDAGSLTEKDWGKIVRWVLPEAKVPFLLKDLKKQDQILAKLATVPNNWTSYIPRMEVIPVILPTQVLELESRKRLIVNGLDCKCNNRPQLRIMRIRDFTEMTSQSCPNLSKSV